MALDTAINYILSTKLAKTPEDIIRYVRIRNDNNTPALPGSQDIIYTIIKKSKKELVLIPYDIRLLNDSGNLESPDKATNLKISIHNYYMNAISSELSKKEMEEFIVDKDKQIQKIENFLKFYPGWKIIQDPWDPNVTPPQNIPPTTTTTTTLNSTSTSPVNATQSTASKIDSDFTFNVEKDKIFQIVDDKLNLGELTMVRRLDPNDPILLPKSESIEEELDEEYAETDYAGADEDPEILKGLEETQSGMPAGNFTANITESDVDNNTPSSVDNVVKKASVKIKPGKEFGAIGKVAKDADILAAMVNFIEGGYFSPAHVSKFNAKSRDLYKTSGETLWGIDRCAGQTEKEEVGRKFWAAVDAISGYGDIGSYSRQTNSGKWDINRYPVRENAWKYGYIPKTSDKGYDIMYSCFVNYAVNHLNDWLNKYFSTHPELKKMILSDARFKFMWFRSTWNGIGWFQWYANGKTRKNGTKINGLKWAYDNVSKDLETLIKWDLNNRLAIANGNHLINHDVEKISSIIGIKSLS